MAYPPKAATFRALTPVEAAWLGAFFDAEGSVNKEKHGKKYRLKVINTEVEFISAFLRLTGVGSIAYREPPQPHHKPCLTWHLTAKNDVLEFVRQCAPYSLKLRTIQYADV